MKKLIKTLLLLFPIICFSQVGIGTSNPNQSSSLDITDTSKGILIPRMTQAQRNAIATPATGLMIYQTNNSPGFYYYNGSAWISLASSSWSTTGNAGTNPSTNKVGTTDNQSFVLATNNTEAVRVTNTGNVGIGTSTPSTKLHVTNPSVFSFTEDFSSSAIGNVSLVTTNNPYSYNTNVGCVAADGWRIDTFDASSAPCTNCSGNRAVIDYGASTCDQDATLVVKTGIIPVTNVTISFDYSFDYIGTPELFSVVLFNETTNSAVTTLLSLTADAEDTSFSGPATLTAGQSYSLRFRYVGNYGWGLTIDNILIESGSKVMRIQDGFEGNGKVLVSNATGQATWQTPTPSPSSDGDWTWNSGSTVADPIYHVGGVFIGTGATTSTYNLKVWNGAATGSRVDTGSIEYLIDDANELRISDLFTPLVNNSQDMGIAGKRWTAVYAGTGTINTSDERLKENIQPIHYGLSELLKLKPVTFKWKVEKEDDFIIPNEEKELKLGLIAQEVQQVIPDVIVDKEWYVDGEHPENGLQQIEAPRLGISYSELIPVTIKAIQDQQSQIEELKKTNEELKLLIAKLKKEKGAN